MSALMETVKKIIEHPYLVSSVIILGLIVAIIAVTNYYATYYPTTNATDIPRNSIVGSFTNIFNGYSEKVGGSPVNITAASADAWTSVEETSIGLVIALALVIAYLIQMKDRASLKYKWKVVGSFIAALLVSQYAIQLYKL